MKIPTEVVAAINAIDPALLETPEEATVAALLLLSYQNGADLKKIAKLMRARVRELSSIATKLRKNGVWSDGLLTSDWTRDPQSEDSAIEFCLDVNIGLGFMARTGNPGAYRYRATAAGMKRVERMLMNKRA